VLTSLSVVLALAVFWLLGRSGSFDASAKLVAIEHAFHITAVLFLPLVLVVAAIFLAALVGGCLAMAVAPERVVAFSAAGEALPRGFARIRGVWLALANGYQAEHGSCGDRSARLARRPVRHAGYNLAGDCRGKVQRRSCCLAGIRRLAGIRGAWP